jgi:hypothetical protein
MRAGNDRKPRDSFYVGYLWFDFKGRAGCDPIFLRGIIGTLLKRWKKLKTVLMKLIPPRKERPLLSSPGSELFSF